MDLKDPDTVEEQIYADELHHEWNMLRLSVDRYMHENYHRCRFGDYLTIDLKGRY